MRMSVLLLLALTFAGCVSSVSTPSPSQSSLADIEASLESIYSQTNPSVVNIQVSLPATPLSPADGALGSGFVWDNQGNVVTDNHFVDGAKRITVTFHDGTTVEASLVGTDADGDLAIIKVEPNAIQLQPVTG